MANTPINTELIIQQPRLLEQVVAKMRAKHYSLRTEKTYIDWIKCYIWHHDKRHPKDMGAERLRFLTHLAMARHVSASTQNQSLSALLFLYREIIELELPWLNKGDMDETSFAAWLRNNSVQR